MIISVAEELASDDVGWAMHLVDHDEAPEGIAALAWSLDEARGGLDPTAVAELNELIGGLVPEESLPDSMQQPGRREAAAAEGSTTDEAQQGPDCCQ